MADFASSHHREYDSRRGQILQKTHQGQISRSKSKWTVFLQYQTNKTYFVYTERRKNDHCHKLRLSCKLYENRLRTHRVMDGPWLFALKWWSYVFLRKKANNAYLNTFQRREKVEQNIRQIFWKFHESNRVFDRVMTLAFEAFFMFEGCLSAKNKTLRSISIRKSILWLISHLHTIENTILDRGPILRNTNQLLCNFAGKIFNKHHSKHENASRARVITLSNTRSLSWSFQNFCQMCCSTFSLLWNVFKYTLFCCLA